MRKIFVVAVMALTLAGCETARQDRVAGALTRRKRRFDRRLGHAFRRWGCRRRRDWRRGWRHYRGRDAARPLLLISPGPAIGAMCALPLMR